MRLYTCAVAFFLLFSCKTNERLKKNDTLINVNTEFVCPDDGVCTFEAIPNKSFRIKDSYGDTYPEFFDSNKTVLKFHYKRNEIPNTQDSSYSEFVYLEVDSDTKSLELQGYDLAKANVVFGRVCFCRGQKGYFKVTQGKLNLYRFDQNKFNLNLEFTQKRVPQTIKIINGVFE